MSKVNWILVILGLAVMLLPDPTDVITPLGSMSVGGVILMKGLGVI